MNKKLLLGVTLAALVGLPSCIDENEAPGTTQVRQAKVAQLNALANLNNANAQAEAIAAAATQEAQAAFAAYQEALAAYQNAQTELEKIELQKKLELAALKLQEDKANLEATLINNQAQVALQEKLLAKAIKDADVKEAGKLNAYLQTYQNLNKSLIETQKNLALNQIALEEAKLGKGNSVYQQLLANVEFYEGQVSDCQKEIDNVQASIDVDAAAYPTAAAMQAQVTALKKDMAAADTVKKEMATIKAAADKTVKDAAKTLENSLYEQAAADSLRIALLPWKFSRRISYTPYINLVEGENMIINSELSYFNFSKNIDVKIPVVSTTVNAKNYAYSFGEGQKQMNVTYSDYTTLGSVIPGAQEAVVAALQQIIDNTTAAGLEGAKRNLADAQAAQAAYKALAAAAKAVEDADKAVTEAGDKVTAAQTKALEDAQKAQDDLETKYMDNYFNGINYLDLTADDVNDGVENAEQSVENAQEALDQSNANLAQVNAAFALIAKYAPARAENLKAFNAALAAQAEAEANKNIAENTYNTISGQIDGLNNILNNSGLNQYYQSKLAYYQEQLENAEANLAEARQALADADPLNGVNAEGTDMQKVVADLEATIAKQQVQVEGLKKQVAIVQQQIEDAINAQE